MLHAHVLCGTNCCGVLLLPGIMLHLCCPHTHYLANRMQILPDPHCGAPVTCFLLAPCGGVLISGGTDGLLRAWPLASHDTLTCSATSLTAGSGFAVTDGRQQGLELTTPRATASVPRQLPPCQIYDGHVGTVAGACATELYCTPDDTSIHASQMQGMHTILCCTAQTLPFLS